MRSSVVSSTHEPMKSYPRHPRLNCSTHPSSWRRIGCGMGHWEAVRGEGRGGVMSCPAQFETHTNTHTHIHIHTYTHTYTHAHIQTRTHAHTNIRTRTHTHTMAGSSVGASLQTILLRTVRPSWKTARRSSSRKLDDTLLLWVVFAWHVHDEAVGSTCQVGT